MTSDCQQASSNQASITVTYSFNVAVYDVARCREAVGSNAVLTTDVALHFLAYAVVKP